MSRRRIEKAAGVVAGAARRRLNPGRETGGVMRGLVRILGLAVATAAALFVTAGGQAANAPGSPPSLSWSPATSGVFDFGTRTGAVSQQFTLTNSGGSASAALTIEVSPTAGPFTITADGCSGTSLGPKRSCKVTVL